MRLQKHAALPLRRTRCSGQIGLREAGEVYGNRVLPAQQPLHQRGRGAQGILLCPFALVV